MNNESQLPLPRIVYIPVFDFKIDKLMLVSETSDVEDCVLVKYLWHEDTHPCHKDNVFNTWEEARQNMRDREYREVQRVMEEMLGNLKKIDSMKPEELLT